MLDKILAQIYTKVLYNFWYILNGDEGNKNTLIDCRLVIYQLFLINYHNINGTFTFEYSVSS